MIVEIVKIKVGFSHLECLVDFLQRYNDFLVISIGKQDIHGREFENLMIEISAGIELYHRLKKKANARFPSQKYTLTLALFEAIILQRALFHVIGNTNGIFEKNTAEILKNTINPKIIGITTNYLITSTN